MIKLVMLTRPLLSLFVGEVGACVCFGFLVFGGGLGFALRVRCWPEVGFMCITSLIGCGSSSSSSGSSVSSSGASCASREFTINFDFNAAFPAVCYISHSLPPFVSAFFPTCHYH